MEIRRSPNNNKFAQFFFETRCIVVNRNDCSSTCMSQICHLHQGHVLSPVLFAVYIRDLSCEVVSANIACCVMSMSICCLFHADDIVLFTGLLHQSQIVLSICNTEMPYLDLKFNSAKCSLTDW